WSLARRHSSRCAARHSYLPVHWTILHAVKPGSGSHLGGLGQPLPSATRRTTLWSERIRDRNWTLPGSRVCRHSPRVSLLPCYARLGPQCNHVGEGEAGVIMCRERGNARTTRR